MRLMEELRNSFGLVLVTAPVFNGANTTAYAIMNFLVRGQRDVVSLETPICWPVEGVRQVEVEAGGRAPRMEETLRSIVAVRPEVLVLSQVPDRATAVLVAQLASSVLVVAEMPVADGGPVDHRHAAARRAAAAAGGLAGRHHLPAPGPPDLPHLPPAGRSRRRRRPWRTTASPPRRPPR